MHREEGDVVPAKVSQKLDLARALVVHPPRDLREPVVDPAEHREDRRAEDHEVEVGDDEVGVGHLLVERDRGEHHAGEPADDEEDDEADDPQQRRLEARRAGEDRRDPGEELDRRWG